ncbi:MAG: hypothetical protein K2K57_08565 [Oscillospiraceae bacterium]|nr:hypothetical protein [Oscillospiraceae bacterium]
MTKFIKIFKYIMFLPTAFVLMYIALYIGVAAINDINAEAMKSELAKEAKANNLTVTAAYCKVGRFGGNGNGTEYLAVIFLSDVPKNVPKEGAWNGCRLYMPEDYEDGYGHCIAPPEDYKCAAVKVISPENFLLYDFDLRGH